MDFSNYLEQKYLDWQQEEGQRKTLDEFSVYLGISRPLLSLYLSGKRKPGSETVKMLSNVFGPEVYDVLEIERPDPRLAYIQQIWEQLPPESQNALHDDAKRYLAEGDETTIHTDHDLAQTK